MLGTAFSAPLEKDVSAEWQRLRELLRAQGYPVAARAVTPQEIAADMRRVRIAMERRAGKTPVSDMQRIGGGGGAPAPKNKNSWKLGDTKKLGQ